MRKIIFYLVFLGGYTGIMRYCCTYTSDYGEVFAKNWVISFSLGLILDLLFYEGIIWLAYLMNENSAIGRIIRGVKNLKVV